MNSPRDASIGARDPASSRILDNVIKQRHEMCDGVARSEQATSLLGQSRVAMAEVQVCGIPKLSAPEVVPT
jgi:hypothetical protein